MSFKPRVYRNLITMERYTIGPTPPYGNETARSSMTLPSVQWQLLRDVGERNSQASLTRGIRPERERVAVRGVDLASTIRPVCLGQMIRARHMLWQPPKGAEKSTR